LPVYDGGYGLNLAFDFRITVFDFCIKSVKLNFKLYLEGVVSKTTKKSSKAPQKKITKEQKTVAALRAKYKKMGLKPSTVEYQILMREHRKKLGTHEFSKFRTKPPPKVRPKKWTESEINKTFSDLRKKKQQEAKVKRIKKNSVAKGKPKAKVPKKGK